MYLTNSLSFDAFVKVKKTEKVFIEEKKIANRVRKKSAEHIHLHVFKFLASQLWKYICHLRAIKNITEYYQ